MFIQYNELIIAWQRRSIINIYMNVHPYKAKHATVWHLAALQLCDILLGNQTTSRDLHLNDSPFQIAPSIISDKSFSVFHVNGKLRKGLEKFAEKMHDRAKLLSVIKLPGKLERFGIFLPHCSVSIFFNSKVNNGTRKPLFSRILTWFGIVFSRFYRNIQALHFSLHIHIYRISYFAFAHAMKQMGYFGTPFMSNYNGFFFGFQIAITHCIQF